VLIGVVFLDCIARTMYVEMRSFVTDRAAWSVCLLFCHTSEPCENRSTDRDAIWVEDSVDPVKHVLDGVQIPHGKGDFEGGEGWETGVPW